MHIKPMQQSDGSFSKWKKANIKCPRCGKQKVKYIIWESSCGGYEDYKFKCKCGYTWWVDGIDS